jgi:uncharacterized membrane protein YkvA (DUF1232 family)
MKNPFKRYKLYFTENRLLKKVRRFALEAGLKTTYAVLLLFYAFRKKETPIYAKNIIIGVLGYFIAPIDGIPDLTPVFGFTDDFGVLMFGLITLACYIDDEVKTKARGKLMDWFGTYEEMDLLEVDQKL